MKKSELLNFVGRYHLAGATTSVKWVAKNGKLETEFITDDQNVIGNVKNKKKKEYRLSHRLLSFPHDLEYGNSGNRSPSDDSYPKS